jgi:hypothetical protein
VVEVIHQVSYLANMAFDTLYLYKLLGLSSGIEEFLYLLFVIINKVCVCVCVSVHACACTSSLISSEYCCVDCARC